MLKGLNHITLAVTDLERSLAFYVELLGCEQKHVWATGAYLEVGDTWLCLSLDAERSREPSADYTHIAFSIDPGDVQELRARLEVSGAEIWKENRSEGASVYFLDPDGHKLEAHVGALASRLKSIDGVRLTERTDTDSPKPK